MYERLRMLMLFWTKDTEIEGFVGHCDNRTNAVRQQRKADVGLRSTNINLPLSNLEQASSDKLILVTIAFYILFA